ncbi:nitric oxide reductase (cytochrome c) subunit E (plasmid) [Rhizobium phaseoli]|uniref:Nitric oxide reductase (Cytochrome c) subunit E n=2 Tax=Rhizobium phaseoli TaxID=396 RepID=A0ABN4QS23_9HYPH|nr:nitric oxide reductase (cytochrome c) subunit E [Rhizobium phaseoli]ANL42916.1 nitric oxide reductase (cytochrome c) subunit E [Rhizobium phaseoli]ANL55596.1 nitric oxide reductase (cytochrome c) subunit E [Rhizobium phaseoli]ANL61902.1 nitric oxide reductase (cytochrome c) subunit E [Rhizobium phaseoli]ANL87317.1 nitric oxide reductase (cytochrome c) subunit E [Rhizobium phaseoli]
MTAMISSEPHGQAAPQSDDLLVWILAWSELVAFAALLTGFVIASWFQPEAFAAGKARLHHDIAIANTVILLASGWFAALAPRSASVGRQRLALLAAAAGGILFVAVKLYEYRAEGASLLAEDVFSQPYVLITGFHLAHVLFGALVLALMARFPSPENIHLMTTLWHVIDIVWLVMFPVIYLL